MAFDMAGKIKLFKEDKGYGFIKLDNGDDVFFHKTACSRNVTPKKDDRVRCEIEQSEKGYRATRVVFE